MIHFLPLILIFIFIIFLFYYFIPINIFHYHLINFLCGPILCSNIPVFHEVAGSHAIYFNRKEENIDSVIQAVEEFFRLREIGKLPDSSCINKVTWEDAAQKVYQMIVEDINWYKIIE